MKALCKQEIQGKPPVFKFQRKEETSNTDSSRFGLGKQDAGVLKFLCVRATIREDMDRY